MLMKNEFVWEYWCVRRRKGRTIEVEEQESKRFVIETFACMWLAGETIRSYSCLLSTYRIFNEKGDKSYDKTREIVSKNERIA